MNSRYPGTVDFDHAMNLLAKSDRVCALVEAEFSDRGVGDVAALFRSGLLEGEILGQLEDFIWEMIPENAETVWAGETFDPDDEENIDARFPVEVKHFESLYFVWSIEMESVGYFLSKDEATDYCEMNWTNLEGADVLPAKRRTRRS